MAFSNFQTISEVLETYGIRYEEAPFIVPTGRMPSPFLPEMLQFVGQNTDVHVRQVARKPLIVTPILLEVFRSYSDRLVFWVDKPLHDERQFAGVPDFVFALKSPLGIPVMGVPRVVIIEAKKNDFEQGWGQCLAELVAAQTINRENQKPIHGIVTDGVGWQFGRLQNTVFTENKGNYFADRLNALFGAIDFVLKSSL